MRETCRIFCWFERREDSPRSECIQVLVQCGTTLGFWAGPFARFTSHAIPQNSLPQWHPPEYRQGQRGSKGLWKWGVAAERARVSEAANINCYCF